MENDVYYILLLMICYLIGCTADATSYNIKTDIARSLLPNIPVSMVTNATNKIAITKVGVSTTTLAIQWKYLHTFNGTHNQTVVGYLSGSANGRFISDNLDVLRNEFEFRNLQADTKYDVCVEMLELGKKGQTISHFKCVEMKTLATIRHDSIIAMLITIGYLIFMGIVGCIVWRHRVLVNERTRLQEEEVGESSTVRWKDIEEKRCLNSIEDSVDV
ncbi:hypothetical protein LOTGIDRAFT_168848 [Lottia gigantea]|uniref:Uncharacterized protein n=1 Tax=Lottia gigantea TaxID=225164 RepID=V3ZPJ4_LOTGI|nr:hypothetical protein LOTGIDRAFT_168848 [Lottia gigantea]ESO84395.1 hypothetical protein LOTGIDRAFT_168848 [Lottia gigantea]